MPGAPGSGARLIKSSWGTGWGNARYFRPSYYDSKGANGGFASYDAVPVSTCEKVYY